VKGFVYPFSGQEKLWGESMKNILYYILHITMLRIMALALIQDNGYPLPGEFLYMVNRVSAQ
jgi:hypothetical protein